MQTTIKGCHEKLLPLLNALLELLKCNLPILVEARHIQDIKQDAGIDDYDLPHAPYPTRSRNSASQAWAWRLRSSGPRLCLAKRSMIPWVIR